MKPKKTICSTKDLPSSSSYPQIPNKLRKKSRLRPQKSKKTSKKHDQIENTPTIPLESNVTTRKKTETTSNEICDPSLRLILPFFPLNESFE